MEGFAVVECIFAKAFYATGDGYGFECCTLAERIGADAFYGIGLPIMRYRLMGKPIMRYRFRNIHRYQTAIVGAIVHLVGYLHSVWSGIAGDVVE